MNEKTTGLPSLSTTTRYFVGKIIPGQSSPVSAVYKASNDKRVVVLRNGETLELNKRQFKNTFAKTMSAYQKAEMEKTLHKSRGHYLVKIGGAEKGETRTYRTEAAAKAALTRKYGKSQR